MSRTIDIEVEYGSHRQIITKSISQYKTIEDLIEEVMAGCDYVVMSPPIHSNLKKCSMFTSTKRIVVYPKRFTFLKYKIHK